LQHQIRRLAPPKLGRRFVWKSAARKKTDRRNLALLLTKDLNVSAPPRARHQRSCKRFGPALESSCRLIRISKWRKSLDDASRIDLGFPYDLYNTEMLRAFAYGGMQDSVSNAVKSTSRWRDHDVYSM